MAGGTGGASADLPIGRRTSTHPGHVDLNRAAARRSGVPQLGRRSSRPGPRGGPHSSRPPRSGPIRVQPAPGRPGPTSGPFPPRTSLGLPPRVIRAPGHRPRPRSATRPQTLGQAKEERARIQEQSSAQCKICGFFLERPIHKTEMYEIWCRLGCPPRAARAPETGQRTPLLRAIIHVIAMDRPGSPGAISVPGPARGRAARSAFNRSLIKACVEHSRRPASDLKLP